jgi:large subunit ribosomal protein L3
MGLLGKKIGMTRVYNEMGAVIPVTVIEAGPCKVLQVKSEAKEGYNAVQIGFGAKRASRITKPLAGHFSKAGTEGYYNIREFRIQNPENYQVGQDLNLGEIFKAGDVIDIQGVSKGKGFQGVMKRHGFKGGPSAWPGRVVKGKKLPGRMGTDTVLKKNVLIVDIRDDENVILVKGSVPGAKEGLLKLFSK